MATNIGIEDRLARIALGAALIAFALNFIYPNSGYNWIGWIGVVPLLTALVGNCPLYSIAGISTCARKT